MGTQKINTDLQEVYQKFKIDLIKLIDEDQINFNLNNFSAPLLMNINEQYINSSPKVLLIGQETCGWGDSINFSNLTGFLSNDIDSVSSLISKYRDFNFAEKARNNTPFWRFYKQLHGKLKMDFGKSYPNHIVWTNIFKFDYHRKALSNEQKNIFKSINGELLKKEIEIIQPDMILFVTGWRYDEFIRAAFLQCEYERIEEGYLAKINHQYLPPHTFRTFHPHTLQLQKKFGLVFDLINESIE